MTSFSVTLAEPVPVRLRRLFVGAAGAAALGIAIYRLPVWLEIWTLGAVVAAVVAAAAMFVLALRFALQGSADAVERVALELVFLACALVGVNAVLLGLSPETWSTDTMVRHVLARERAAGKQGIEYDGRSRLRSDVVAELRSRGVDAVPGVSQSAGTSGAVAAAIRSRGILPLSNASNAHVVECNEGRGYFQFRADEFGFNNPAGLTSRPVDIAVIGESLALGHCIPQSESAVDLIRERHRRTANFGIAGSRVLSQLGVLREYVQPLEPSVVIWFVNPNFAEPREEADQPLLTRYLDDPSYSQHLRERPAEVDAFVREVLVPLHTQADEGLRKKLEAADEVPLKRLLTLADVRALIDFGPAHRPPPRPDLTHFKRALELAAHSVAGWGGRLLVVVLPRYDISTGSGVSVARYEAVRDAVASAGVDAVDGAELFAAQPDIPSLYTLRIDNHPSARGHALLAAEILEALQHEEAK